MPCLGLGVRGVRLGLGGLSVSACATCVSLQVCIDSGLKLIAAVVLRPRYIPCIWMNPLSMGGI